MPVFSQPVHPSDLSQHTGEILTNASHVMITGGTLTSINHLNAQKNGFQILQKHVAPAAFHNSKQRVDPPRCHPCTREAVLEEIFEWVVGNIPRETWIAWLNGAAGAGKSAICQSIAEGCIQRGILVASFFFFRADSSRNTIDPLVATLAYQIIQLLPQTKKAIVEAIESNPLIFEQTFDAQLDMLIVCPLCSLHITDPTIRLLLIIDGVDECAGEKTQMNLIRTMAKLMGSRDLPFTVLFGSRRENQILMAFNSRNAKGILTQFPLDDNYHPEKDILRFLNDSFEELKQAHPYSEHLSPEWPSPDHVQEIASKSSGQFIYASVVDNFLSAPSANPSVRLDIIRGLRPTGRLMPFAQLDALYCYIFSQVDDISTALEILAYMVFGDMHKLSIISNFFELEDADIQTILGPLASVLVCNLGSRTIYFRHASLPDFLCDKSRSTSYCINTLATPLCISWFKKARSGHFNELPLHEQNVDISDPLKHAKTTAELHANLLLYTPSQHRSYYDHGFLQRLRGVVHVMNFGDGGEAYNTIVETEHYREDFLYRPDFTEEKRGASQIQRQPTPEESKKNLPTSESDTTSDER